MPSSNNSHGSAEFRDRLFLAWQLWEIRHKRQLTQTDLGVRIKRAGGELVSQPTISSWRKDVVPSLEQVYYLAKALSDESQTIDPGWLAYGKSSCAPGPPDPVKAQTAAIPERKRR